MRSKTKYAAMIITCFITAIVLVSNNIMIVIKGFMVHAMKPESAALLAPATIPTSCRISEFSCRNARCIRLDRYCDGVTDCGDMSDEPHHCTVCNRTFYGDLGKTYELKLNKPDEKKLPFLCHFTFTANGHIHGDIVQIDDQETVNDLTVFLVIDHFLREQEDHNSSHGICQISYGLKLGNFSGGKTLQKEMFLLIFDAFKVGRYEPSALDGCPDGYMQLSELGKPFTGGSWCGSSTGYAVYYSETSTITVTIKLFQSLITIHNVVPFELKLRYKFVSQPEALVRFGQPNAPLERGQVSPGTYCTRKFEECHRKPCRLQSPNYPGMYPRNVTCYWSLRQKIIPARKHAMIVVRQENEHKMQMKRSITIMASLNKTGRALKAWRDCTGERDHLIFYDGGSTDDPVLVKYCGGDWLPKVISRGPEMLVAFHSSPFSIPLHSENIQSPLRGFELDVEVLFTDSNSMDYSRKSSTCMFYINASSIDITDSWSRHKDRFGYLSNPKHTLPPNTTCTYQFVGQPSDIVWVYFTSYSHEPLLPAGLLAVESLNETICLVRLRIWEGSKRKPKLLENSCNDDFPRLCDHTSLANSTRITRPCLQTESYISNSNRLTIEHFTEEGTALHPTSFKFGYEFIDTKLDGDYWFSDIKTTAHCSRLFKNRLNGEITSPKNVFMFGRGGNQNLTCVYRIEVRTGERVHLMLQNITFGKRSKCKTQIDIHTKRPVCKPDKVNGHLVNLEIVEIPWSQKSAVRFPRVCICSMNWFPNKTTYHYYSISKTVEVHFRVLQMAISEDYVDFNFAAVFETVPVIECDDYDRHQEYNVSDGGEIQLNYPPVKNSRFDLKHCDHLPWFLQSHGNRSLFLLTWGTYLPLQSYSSDDSLSCLTTNRLILYSGNPIRILKVICPSQPYLKEYEVHIYSEEWYKNLQNGLEQQNLPMILQPYFLIEFINEDSTKTARFQWLEITKPRSLLLQELHIDLSEIRQYLPSSLSSISSVTHNITSALLMAASEDWDCRYRCPELNACISSNLWCNGHQNCPSGYDENQVHCGGFNKQFFDLFPQEFYSTTTIVTCIAISLAIVLFSVLILLIYFCCWNNRPKQDDKSKSFDLSHRTSTKSFTTDELFFDRVSTVSSS